jgi:integrase
MSVYKENHCGRVRWVVELYKHGKRIRYFTDPQSGLRFSSSANAKKAEATFLLENTKPNSEVKKTSCKDLADLFILALRKKNKISTVFCRQNYYKNYLAPEFEGFNVEDITNDDLDRINDRFNSKAPEGSLGNVIATARMYVRFLRKWNGSLLPERFFPFINSKAKSHQYHFYTFDEERHFLSVIKDPKYKLMFTLFCYYGFRLTECLALKYSDFDFENKTISVQRILLTKSGYKEQIFTSPKTKRSIRTLSLIPEVEKMVLEQKEKAIGEFLFPGSSRSPVMGENHVRLLAKKYESIAGLPKIKVHEFRHSCASNLIRSGVPLRIVARWLGDTETTVLSYYSHMFPDEENAVSSFFEKSPLV